MNRDPGEIAFLQSQLMLVDLYTYRANHVISYSASKRFVATKYIVSWRDCVCDIMYLYHITIL